MEYFQSYYSVKLPHNRRLPCSISNCHLVILQRNKLIYIYCTSIFNAVFNVLWNFMKGSVLLFLYYIKV